MRNKNDKLSYLGKVFYEKSNYLLPEIKQNVIKFKKPKRNKNVGKKLICAMIVSSTVLLPRELRISPWDCILKSCLIRKH